MDTVAVLVEEAGRKVWRFSNGKTLPLIAGGAPTVEELMEKRENIVKEAEEILARYEGGKTPEGEDETRLRALNEEHTTVEGDLNKALELVHMAEGFGAARQAADKLRGEMRDQARPGLYEGGGDGKPAAGARQYTDVTPGDLFVSSDAYKGWKARFPSGGPTKTNASSDAADIGVFRDLLGLATSTERMRGRMEPQSSRDLISAADASAGDLVLSLRRGLIEPGLVRPLTVRDLVTVIPVTTDSIEWAKEVTRTSNAAIVAEAAALTGTSGTKPEGGLTFDVVTDTVKTIAEWVAVTKQIVADAGQLRAYIDQYLADDLAVELEDQMISGAGGGELTGILNSSPQTQTGWDSSVGQNILDSFRFAKRKIRVLARTTPTAILVNPEDLETIDTLKAAPGFGATPTFGSGPYYGQNPFTWVPNTRLWGVPLVESEAVDQGTALMGDFTRAVLYDRESTAISVGTAGDDFIRNILRVLAEMRAGFGVIRPSAFCAITLQDQA